MPPRRWYGTSQTRPVRSEEHTSELQSQSNLVCRLLLEKKKEQPRERNAAIHSMLLAHAALVLPLGRLLRCPVTRVTYDGSTTIKHRVQHCLDRSITAT